MIERQNLFVFLLSIGNAIWENAITPIEAVIFQPIFFILCSRN